ncbi:MAG: hypothetical protein LBG46_03275, partial [Elusimicrobiota bacterium]|nr:hypothetical protein [Elusimicrobiota bacterium]
MRIFYAIIYVLALCVLNTNAQDEYYQKVAEDTLRKKLEEAKITYPPRNNKTNLGKSQVKDISVIMPEDGSITTAKWFFNTNQYGGFGVQDIADALKDTGITPVNVGVKG